MIDPSSPSITVLTVSWHSRARLAHLFDNLLGKATNPSRVQFLVVDNTGGNDESLAEFLYERPRCRLLPCNARALQPSVAHAKGLSHGLSAVTTEFALIVDPDVHVFLADWDVRCVEWLNRGRVTAVGAPYPFWKLGKYHDFPSPIFCFGKKDALLGLGNDWRPFYPTAVGRLYSFFARKIVRLGPLGSKARLQQGGAVRRVTSALERLLSESATDTGYRMARRARTETAECVLFHAVCPSEPAVRDNPALRELASEYELFSQADHIVLTHQYSSASYHWRTAHGPDVEYWLECVRSVESGTPCLKR